jgi:uncharacterized protein YjbI with pentapeptide repeats
MVKSRWAIPVLVGVLMLAGCGGESGDVFGQTVDTAIAATLVAMPSGTPRPTYTLYPTYTPLSTPEPIVVTVIPLPRYLCSTRALDLSGVWLEGRSDFSGKDLAGVRFDGALIQDASFVRADLTGANFSAAEISDSEFFEAEMEGVSFAGAYLDNVELWGSTLSRADFSGASLNGVLLGGSDLSGASFHQADLNGVSLEAANLSGADLSWARFTDQPASSFDLMVELSYAILKGANLEGTELANAVLEGATYDDETIFPAGFDPEAAGMIRDEP